MRPENFERQERSEAVPGGGTAKRRTHRDGCQRDLGRKSVHRSGTTRTNRPGDVIGPAVPCRPTRDARAMATPRSNWRLSRLPQRLKPELAQRRRRPPRATSQSCALPTCRARSVRCSAPTCSSRVSGSTSRASARARLHRAMQATSRGQGAPREPQEAPFAWPIGVRHAGPRVQGMKMVGQHGNTRITTLNSKSSRATPSGLLRSRARYRDRTAGCLRSQRRRHPRASPSAHEVRGGRGGRGAGSVDT